MVDARPLSQRRTDLARTIAAVRAGGGDNQPGVQAVIKPAPAPGFVIADLPEPTPGPNEVLLRVAAASVCGSDVHLYDWNSWARSRVRPPRVIGHEICGEVIGRGAGADLADGTRVAVESHIVCGHCAACRNGDVHVCINTRILGVDVDGGFAAQVVVPQANVIPVGPEMRSEVAAALEPFGNAVHACSYGDLASRTIAVFGCGPIGCAAIAVARARGAGTIIAVDRIPYRLELAERMGAHHLLVADDDVENAIAVAARGTEVDCALEMSGSPRAVVAAVRVVRPGGWISLLGLGDGPVSIDLSSDVVMKGLSLHGVVGRQIPQSWDSTLAHVRSGAIDGAALITHSFEFGEIEAAIELIKSGRCGKVSLLPS